MQQFLLYSAAGRHTTGVVSRWGSAFARTRFGELMKNATLQRQPRARQAAWLVMLALLALAGCGEDPPIVGVGSVDTASAGSDAALDDVLPVGTDTFVGELSAVDTPDVPAQTDVVADVAQDVPDVQQDIDTGPSCPSDHCLIAGVCYTNLASNPANACQRCFALSDQVAWSSDDTAQCDDGSSCTPDDHCADGKCTGTATKDCGDGNACTKDDCTPTGGCTHTNLNDASPCDDGNGCTSGDVCVNSVCLPGLVTTNCDDGDSCTVDGCDVALGCEHTATGSGACDDGNACTGNDTCGISGCAGSTLNCDDGSVCTVDSCDLFKGCVHDAAIGALCADSNPCTDETCDPLLGCVYPNNSALCDDGNLCTTGDHCDNGKCIVAKTNCDDKNVCTDDSCSAASGACFHLPNAATCSDDDVCTLGDSCASNYCWPGDGKLPCDDGNVCTNDTCDPTAGCQTSAGGGICDDGNACTVGDKCVNKGCAGLPLDCDDNSVCTIDSCDPSGGCKHDNAIAASCKDDNPCTDETCDPMSGCVYPFNSVPCDDSNICTVADTCTSGACLGAGVDTNDNNPCTDDACDKVLGIVHVPNTLPCDDNNVCTLNDTCGAGTCQPGSTPLSCEDSNLCTDNTCDPVNGCVFNANTLSCDDNSVCTVNDTCANKACGGTAIVCDDGNDCTTDSCDAIKGCAVKLIINHQCRPTIIINYPPRAATIKGDLASPTLTVLGHVTDAAGPITSLTVNGSSVTMAADGSFSYPMATAIGGNEIVVIATDSFGTQKEVVQSYLWSNAYYKPVWGDHSQGIIDPGLAYYLSPSVIDDGDHSLPANDLATVFEQVLGTYDLKAFIPTTVVTNGITININTAQLKYDPAKVVLTAQAGYLHMVAKISNISVPVSMKYIGITITGTLTATDLTITTDLVPSVDAGHNAVVTMPNTTVAMNGAKVTLSNAIVNFLLGGLINGFVNSAVGNLTSSLVPQLKTSLEPALSSAFNALAFKTQFQIAKLDGSGNKITVDLYNDYNSITCATDGMIFMMRPRASSQTDPAVVNYDALGIPARAHCGDGKPQTVVVTKVGKMELSISDDAFNELLGAVWNGGLLEFPVGPSLLGNIDLTSYGVTDLVMNLDAMLPPVMEDCGWPAPVAQIGDFKVTGSLKLFGSAMDFTMYATFKTDVAVTASNSAIGIALNGIKSADVQVDIVQDNMAGNEAALATLVKDQVLGALVGKLTGSALGSFPIPAINLNVGGASVTLTIATDQVVRQEGDSIVQGHLQ